MDCLEAQEQILDSLAAPQRGASSPDLYNHLAECDKCRRFFKIQQQLDLQLGLAISAPSLNPRFRQSVIENLRREPFYLWPEFLPDRAHFAGCICATALCIWMLPFSAGSILSAGLIFTLVTYFIQSVVRSSLETWEEGQR
jgi:predicted anti-sigma-YlaC factor YlaD